MTWKNNHWVKFLEGYCKGKNQIQDEYVRKVAKRLGIEIQVRVEVVSGMGNNPVEDTVKLAQEMFNAEEVN